jgi:hypothetical protein
MSGWRKRENFELNCRKLFVALIGNLVSPYYFDFLLSFPSTWTHPFSKDDISSRIKILSVIKYYINILPCGLFRILVTRSEYKICIFTLTAPIACNRFSAFEVTRIVGHFLFLLVRNTWRFRSCFCLHPHVKVLEPSQLDPVEKSNLNSWISFSKWTQLMRL